MIQFPVLSIVCRKASNFLKLPLSTKLGLIPCWLLLGLAKLLILFVPFRLLAPKLGRHASIAPWVPVISSMQESRARSYGRLVRLTARYTPWDSSCFPQAVVARIFLGVANIPYAMYFGLMKDANSGEMKAHAWVVTGRVTVTGGSSFQRFTAVGCFVAPGLLKSLP